MKLHRRHDEIEKRQNILNKKIDFALEMIIDSRWNRFERIHHADKKLKVKHEKLKKQWNKIA